MTYYFSKKVKLPFEETVQRLTRHLQQQGFGVITKIDLKETFNRKLGIEFRRYLILGACNPEFAYKAITLESHLGVLLPCNLVVQEHENGEVEVSAINSLYSIDRASSTPQLSTISREVSNRLRVAVDNLHRTEIEPKHPDALPDDGMGRACRSFYN